MRFISKGWKNKKGTGARNCACGTWKDHWLNFSNQEWPQECSVLECEEEPTLGAHIYSPDVSGEKIVPACDSCNKRTDSFFLKDDVVLVSANKSETCEKPKFKFK